MNWIDYIIFAILFINAAIGLANGPVIQFLRILSLFVSFFVTILFYEILANILKSTFTLPAAYMLGYFIIFGTAFIITHIVIDIIKRIMDKWEISIGFKLFGGLLGIINGLVFCGMIILGVISFSGKITISMVNESKVAPVLGFWMQNLVSAIPERVVNKIKSIECQTKKDTSPKDKKASKEDGFKSITQEKYPVTDKEKK